MRTAFASILLFTMLASAPAISREADDMVLRGDCEDGPMKAFCEDAKNTFAKEYAAALRGNYDAQRNVAFCLSTGCDGAVRQDRSRGCAWRFVIILSGSPKIAAGDRMNLQACRKLDEVDFLAARTQAAELYRRIYRRAAPPF